ncbi:MAG: right-handed parallel beta-helix repeat-containing protein [Phycisphaerales bacterium]|nr:hypothetical protein [Phycisphaerales bacterium]
MKTRTGVLGVVVLATVFVGWSFAGDLNPPPGTVMPTMKTLDEVEPRTPLDPADVPIVIGSSGSYYITGNFSALIAGQDAITINADDVTLDLNGFSIRNTEIGFFNRGVVIASSAENVHILNGAIIGCDLEGVSGPDSMGVSVSGLRVGDCGGNGIYLGSDANVRGCTLVSNNEGARVGNGSAVHNTVANSNQSHGITIVGTGTISGCSANSNGGAGFASGFAGNITDCSARGNDTGIYGGTGSLIARCTVFQSASHGVRVDNDARVIDTTTSSNGGNGIDAGDACAIERCTVNENEINGVLAGIHARVIDCTASENGVHGIETDGDATIKGNNCDSNGVSSTVGAGVLVTGADCRVEDNNCTDNDYGFLTFASGCLIVRNSASGNTTANFNISAGNDLGTIQTSPIGAGPWDNFEF